MGKTNINNYQIDELENKSKSQVMEAALHEKLKSMHKIGFHVKNRYHAVYLNEKKLKDAEEKAKAQGISVIQHYIQKYSA